MSLPKQLLESKLITDEQWEEYQQLKQDVTLYKSILDMQQKREYYSKFLQDFQKEKGKHTLPDFDEIYKRYDIQKEKIERAIRRIEIVKADEDTTIETHKALDFILQVLKGDDKE